MQKLYLSELQEMHLSMQHPTVLHSYRPHPKDGEGTVFSLFVSPHLDGGGYPSQVWMVWGVPRPGLDGGGHPDQVWMVEWGYPSQVWMVGGTLARSGWWGVPQPEGYPSQVWMKGGTWGTPWPGLDGGWGTLARSGWWGVPQPGLDGGRGVPQPGLDGVGDTLARSGWWGVP